MNKILDAFKKRKKFITDVSLNMIASFAMSGTLQLLIYPYLSRTMTADDYGKFLTLIGISNIVAVTLGNSLNNVRLLRESVYQDKNLKGDFNYFSIISGILVLLLIPTIIAFFHTNTLSIFMITTISLLTYFRSYYSVGYRIVLNYKKYLIQSLIYCAGGVTGLLFVRLTGLWQWPFIVAELSACIYIFFTCGLIREPKHTTELLRGTARDYLFLIFTSVIGNALTYLDRLMLYPILGGENVSIYYTATFFGKTLGVILLPIAGVLLSYYAQKRSMTLKQFWLQSGSLVVACLAFYLVTFELSKPVTGLLYPTLIHSAANYLPIANLSAIILAAASVVQPAVLKFCKTIYQPFIQIIHLAAYIGLGLLFLAKGGLMGFCVAALLANSIKLISLLLVGHLSLRKR